MAYQWHWEVFLNPTVSGSDTYLGWLLTGLQWTVMLSLSAWVVALLLGTLFGVLRTLPIRRISWLGATRAEILVFGRLLGPLVGVLRVIPPSRWLSWLGAAYVEIFRNTPLLVQLFVWYFVLPELLPPAWGDAIKQTNPLLQQFLAAWLCLGCFTGARVAEQVRAGIESLPRGQKAAALALGLTLPQTYRFVLLPMSLRIIVPPLTSEFLNIFKNSAVASTIGLIELSRQAQQLVDYTAQPYEAFIAVTVLYALINVTVMVLMRIVEAKTRVPGYIGTK